MIDSATLSEPEWYAMLTVIARCDDSGELAHEFSRAHPGYSQAVTTAKSCTLPLRPDPLPAIALRHTLADVSIASNVHTEVASNHQSSSAGKTVVDLGSRAALNLPANSTLNCRPS